MVLWNRHDLTLISHRQEIRLATILQRSHEINMFDFDCWTSCLFPTRNRQEILFALTAITSKSAWFGFDLLELLSISYSLSRPGGWHSSLCIMHPVGNQVGVAVACRTRSGPAGFVLQMEYLCLSTIGIYTTGRPPNTRREAPCCVKWYRAAHKKIGPYHQLYHISLETWYNCNHHTRSQ